MVEDPGVAETMKIDPGSQFSVQRRRLRPLPLQTTFSLPAVNRRGPAALFTIQYGLGRRPARYTFLTVLSRRLRPAKPLNREAAPEGQLRYCLSGHLPHAGHTRWRQADNAVHIMAPVRSAYSPRGNSALLLGAAIC